MAKQTLLKTLLPISTIALIGVGITSSFVLSSCNNEKYDIRQFYFDNEDGKFDPIARTISFGGGVKSGDLYFSLKQSKISLHGLLNIVEEDDEPLLLGKIKGVFYYALLDGQPQPTDFSRWWQDIEEGYIVSPAEPILVGNDQTYFPYQIYGENWLQFNSASAEQPSTHYTLYAVPNSTYNAIDGGDVIMTFGKKHIPFYDFTIIG